MEKAEIKIARINSVNDPSWEYDRASYIDALQDQMIVDMIKTGTLMCELSYPIETDMSRQLTIDPKNACAKIITIEDDYITVIPLDNDNGKYLLERYQKNPDEVYAGMRLICKGTHIVKIITFDIIIRNNGGK